jgi:hypothetical protein
MLQHKEARTSRRSHLQHLLKLCTAEKMHAARMAFRTTRPAMAAHVFRTVLDSGLGLCCCEGDRGGDGGTPTEDSSPAEPSNGTLAGP